MKILFELEKVIAADRFDGVAEETKVIFTQFLSSGVVAGTSVITDSVVVEQVTTGNQPLISAAAFNHRKCLHVDNTTK